jgi:outer membrane protein insertion porin family/translocation and assembly module TamA
MSCRGSWVVSLAGLPGLAGLAGLAFGLSACTSIPRGRSAVDAVEIRGTSALDEGDVSGSMATAPTEKFLGLFRGVVYDYEVYDPSVLQRDMARLERYYRGHGFLDAHAREGRVQQVSPNHVTVHILVDEGPPTINRNVEIDGLNGVPFFTSAAVRGAVADKIPRAERFDETKYKEAKEAIKRTLTDRGYAYATVTASAKIDVGTHAADYVFTVTPGPLAKFGPITIVGLDPDGQGPRPQEIDEAPMRRAMNITEGEPFSTKDIESATQALLDLEVFSAVQIVPQLPQPPPPDPVIPLRVNVDPTRLRLLRAGFGAEFDEIKTDLHLVSGWEDHNFLGGLRDLSISFQPGVVLYPLRIGNLQAPNQPLPEERLKVQFRQPSFLEARTSGFLKPEFNVYPFLVEPNPPPNTPVVGYVEAKAVAGVDRPFGKLFVTVSYNQQVEVPFHYVDLGDALPPTIVLGYPQLVTTLDYRDNPIKPHKGIFLGNDFQIADAIFGSTAHDFRVQPEVRGYIPLGKRFTLATRASVGFLFPQNYAINKYLIPDATKVSASELAGLATDKERTLEIEEVYFRGFFSGGPSTNRGFPIRGIAPYGFVPSLLPATASTQVANNCIPGSTNYSPQNCSLPIAGLTLWEFSQELRFAVSGPFSAAVFCDLGDVSPNQTNIRLDHLHMSCGAGARYDTPVGPIRLDIGYRIQPLQVLPYRNEVAAYKGDATNGLPPDLITNVPLAIAFGIGEAY